MFSGKVSDLRHLDLCDLQLLTTERRERNISNLVASLEHEERAKVRNAMFSPDAAT